jgi:hypothetical protein
VPSATAEALKRFSLPLIVSAAPDGEEPIASQRIADPVVPLSPAKNSSPFAEAANRFASPVTAEKDIPFSPRAVSSTAASSPAPAASEEPIAPAEVASIPAAEPPLAQEAQSTEPAASEASDLPWWLSDAPRHAEPSRPPVLWQPAKVWTSNSQPSEAVSAPILAAQNPQPLPSSAIAAKSWEGAPFLPETPTPNAQLASREAEDSVSHGTEDNRNSRLSSLRNLLYVLGVNHPQGGEELVEQHAGVGTNSDLRTERPTFDRTPSVEASSMRGAAPRLVTAIPEFLPPKPLVIEFERGDARTGEPSSRQDRRAAADGLEILPSKRGQYKKI